MNNKAHPAKLKRDWSPVPNNPRENEFYIDKKERRDEARFNKERMLFDKTEDILRRVISKHEPGEPKRTEYLKVDRKQFDKDMKVWKQKSQQASARERLKRKGAVPTKSGKKLFENFMKDIREATGGTKQQNIDDADMKNIYNAARSLDYEKWIWFVNDEYGSRI
jgi:hypothetical protein